MAITMEQAKALQYRDVLHENGGKNADGTCRRWRVNGRIKTWKREPGRIRIPMKHGLRDCDYLDETDLNDVHLGSECPNK